MGGTAGWAFCVEGMSAVFQDVHALQSLHACVMCFWGGRNTHGGFASACQASSGRVLHFRHVWLWL